MVGMGMIFDETYRPFFEHAHAAAVRPAVRRVRRGAGGRRQPHRQPGRGVSQAAGRESVRSELQGANSIDRQLAQAAASISSAWPRPTTGTSPPPRRLEAGKHVLIEKPSVLSLAGTRRTGPAGAREERAGQGRLSQAARSGSQEAAHAGRDGELAARQQRLLHAAGAQADQRRQFAEWIRGAIPAPTSPCITSS
jgi:D-galacturonate reductase